MKLPALPALVEREQLQQMPTNELVEHIVRQQEIILVLVKEVARLKANASSDSQSSSKPQCGDILKRSEKQAESQGECEQRKPGGQPGHQGKTRKGFGRVDRYEVVRPEICPECGEQEFIETPMGVRQYQDSPLCISEVSGIGLIRHRSQSNSILEIYDEQTTDYDGFNFAL
jgi:transposase